MGGYPHEVNDHSSSFPKSALPPECLPSIVAKDARSCYSREHSPSASFSEQTGLILRPSLRAVSKRNHKGRSTTVTRRDLRNRSPLPAPATHEDVEVQRAGHIP